MIDSNRGIVMDSQKFFVMTIIFFCISQIVNLGLFLAHCFGWASHSWGWYPLIAMIGIVPIFGMFLYIMANDIKEAP